MFVLVFYNFGMSLPVHVEAYSGYKANERPMSFSVDMATGENGVTGVYDIAAIEDRWYDPNGEYFKVRTVDGKRYILRYAQREDQWTLQSGFDGAELLARPSIELVTAGPSAIRQAESKIAGCERCRSDESDIPFDWVLAEVLGKHGPFEFVVSEPGRCPNCNGELSERTLVEPQGGIGSGDARLGRTLTSLISSTCPRRSIQWCNSHRNGYRRLLS